MGDKDQKRSFFPSFSKSEDPDLNIPVTGNQTGLKSPFLNFDPAYLSQEDQFIFPEGAGQQRGRFEKAFAQIGGAIMTGAALGAANGVYSGLKETKDLTGSVKRTQMLNIVSKQGASSAQVLGVVALLYSMFGVGISLLRKEDDEINTLFAGTATGLAFKSSAGLKSCLRGGGVGLAVATAYCLVTSPRIKHMLSNR